MPTTAGWLVAATGGLTIVAGRLFGYVELFLVGTVLVLLVGGATLFASLTPLRLELGRAVRPARVHAGGRSEVLLTMRNDGSRRTPVIALHDELRGTPGASLLAAPLERGARATAGYALPTDRRGVIHIGPLTVELSDPFGLARTGTVAVGRTTVTVYPRVVELSAPPRTGGADPHGRRSRGLHHEGDDFHSLRPYVLGDDMRRVHWAATARADDLVVRQLELHRHGRTTVQLDDRAAHHVGGSFDTAVSAAASVLVAAHRRGDEIRLLSSGGHDSGIDDDEHHLDHLLSWLAVAQGRAGAGPTTTAPASRGTAVRITTDVGLSGLPRSGRSDGGTTIVVVTGEDEPGAAVPGQVRIRSADDLQSAWAP